MSFGHYPLAHEITFHGQPGQVAPAEQFDAVDRVLHAMQDAYTKDQCGEREAFLRGLERLREEISPIAGARRRGQPRVSQKARRRTIAALDHFIEAGRSRAF